MEKIDTSAIPYHTYSIVSRGVYKRDATKIAVAFQAKPAIRSIIIKMIEDKEYREKMYLTLEYDAYLTIRDKERTIIPPGLDIEEAVKKSIFFLFYPVSSFYSRSVADTMSIFARRDEYGPYVVMSSTKTPNTYKIDDNIIIIGKGAKKRTYTILSGKKIIGYGFVNPQTSRRYRQPMALARFLANLYNIL